MTKKFKRFLAIDASTERCSVALADGQVRFVDECDTPKSHAKVILPMVDKLLAMGGLSVKQLDAILVGLGPGSFTGIRIGISIAQGLSYGANIPLFGSTSLSMMAVSQHLQMQTTDGGGDNAKVDNTVIVPCLDARMNEVYWSVYFANEEGLLETCNPRVTSCMTLLDYLNKKMPDASLIGVGHGWRLRELNSLRDRAIKIDEKFFPHASGLLHIWSEKFSQSTPEDTPGPIEPVYLRNEVTWEKRKRIRTHFSQ